ncbi:hypothetical protein [Paracraurococcus lichenis]|uniref:Uncharacterized protein n=1 Tax=Paracraurococcus lichenis TaxID=3064888 RepID=A0ABT9E8C7_9PROT|nr:hypothetical protein [Paracraurococcus sp. LOR1-02]MDO9712457.1 hypothetical protein [Paracraurococcus sp. LOR1-02]
MSGSAFKRSVDVFVSRDLSEPERAAHLARVAKAGLAELQGSGRAPEAFRRFVDGREGAREESVKAEGLILYRFSLLAEAATFAMTYLLTRVPVTSGAYRDALWYAVNNRPISRKSWAPDKLGSDVDEVILFDKLPQSRKLDVQLVGGKKLRVKVKPNFFEDAAREVRKAYPSLDCWRLYSVDWPGRQKSEKQRWIDYPGISIRARQ